MLRFTYSLKWLSLTVLYFLSSSYHCCLDKMSLQFTATTKLDADQQTTKTSQTRQANCMQMNYTDQA